MYWKEIPVQVQAEDESGQVSKPLDDRFQEGVDAISMFDGSSGSDEYLMSWEWGDYQELEGTAEEAASKTAAKYNDGFPEDFVARVHGLYQSDQRDPSPGAVENWIEKD